MSEQEVGREPEADIERSWQTIDLDCAPGYPRPGDLIGSVVAGTILEPMLAEPVFKFFGNWQWAFDVDRETWVRDVQPVIQPRIEALYHEGSIRYGSW